MPEEFRDGAGSGAGDAIDIGQLGAEASAPEPGRKPRRLKKDGTPWITRKGGAAGAGAKPAEKVKGTVDLSSLTGMFVGLHVVASTQFNVPELSMDMAEGDQFMKSAQNVLRHYSVETTQKTLDWIAFGGTVMMIYGTRWGAYMIRKKTEAAPRTATYSMPAAPAPNAPRNGSGRAQEPQARPVFTEDVILTVEADQEGD